MDLLRERNRALGHHIAREPVTITAIMIGAAVGAVTAAVTGGNILKGALFGAIGGGISSAMSSAFGAAATGVGGTAAGAEGAMAGSAMGAEAGGAAGMAGAEAGAAAAGVPFEAGFTGTEALTGGTGMMEAAAAAPTTIGTGMEQATIGAGDGGLSMVDTQAAGTGISAPGAGSGLQVNPTDMRLAAATQSTPGGSLVGGGESGSFLDQLLNKGKGMLNSRFVTNMAGNALQGYSSGKMQEAKIAEAKRLAEEQRANARYGNTGSRYGGMIYAPTTYK